MIENGGFPRLAQALAGFGEYFVEVGIIFSKLCLNEYQGDINLSFGEPERRYPERYLNELFEVIARVA